MLRLAWNAARLGWPVVRDLPRRAAEALGQAGPDQPAMPERLWKAMAIVSAIALFVWWALPQLVWVRSPRSTPMLSVNRLGPSPGMIW